MVSLGDGNDKWVGSLYSSVWLPATFDSFIMSLSTSVLISLQRAEINSSKRAGQGRKEISWRFRGISHGLQGGMGLDLSERLRLRALFGKTSSSQLRSQLLSQCHLFLFLMVLQSWIQNPRRGTSWLVLVDCLALIMCHLIIAVRVKTPGYRDKAFSALTIWVSRSQLKQFLEKRCRAKLVYLLFLLPFYFPSCQLTAT